MTKKRKAALATKIRNLADGLRPSMVSWSTEKLKEIANELDPAKN